ncbi:TetR/AcrR family transcriptional regulator [Amycolatopsis mediterranei]|nr:TetR/AcrR family transcriptional regulator [Amycolatopsis mediterranei]UZF73901.1 TetR/AcrR family transcriptional regulator [Amycolatopsis mediterranei]
MGRADHETPGQIAEHDDGQDSAPLRVDAERNRERILDAARRVFAAEGIEVSMSAVARAAGVGVATLFRRFPTREDLLDAVFADTMRGYVEAAEIAEADPDPWNGFTGYIRAVCSMQVANRGFADVLTMTFPAAAHLEEHRARAYEGFLRLIDAAKAAGKLRPDFADQDMVVLLMANAGVITAAGATAPDSSARLVAYLIQAFTAPQSATLPPPPDPDALAHAMLGLDCAGNEKSE